MAKKKPALAKNTIPKAGVARKTARKAREAQNPQPKAHSRTYTIVDHRLEKPDFTLRQVCKGNGVCYEV
jgi:hypothetical protein